GKVRHSTGAARIHRIILLAVGALVLVLASRMSLRGTPPRPQASAAPPPPAVVVTPAIEGTVPVYDESVAQTITVQTVQLRAQIGGTLEQVLFKEGTEVRQGQLLFVIDQRPYLDRKSTRLNSSHVKISYAVFCLKKKKKKTS